MTPAETRGVNAGQMAESRLTPAGMGEQMPAHRGL